MAMLDLGGSWRDIIQTSLELYELEIALDVLLRLEGKWP